MRVDSSRGWSGVWWKTLEKPVSVEESLRACRLSMGLRCRSQTWLQVRVWIDAWPEVMSSISPSGLWNVHWKYGVSGPGSLKGCGLSHTLSGLE
jgi:hypothetical protein